MLNEGKFEFKVKLNSTKEVALLTSYAGQYGADIDVCSCDKHYIVDAKSLMGILGLDLSKPLVVSTNCVEAGESLMNDVHLFVVA